MVVRSHRQTAASNPSPQARIPVSGVGWDGRSQRLAASPRHGESVLKGILVSPWAWGMVFSCLLLCSEFSPLPAAEPVARPSADTLRKAGIRTLQSRHLTLYTDLPPQPAVDALPHVFDLAVPAWAKFFQVAPRQLKDWRVEASIIQNKTRFHQYGLLPKELPDFLNGFQLIDEIWIYEQPSDYYRRHLLLHEGTHAVMNRIYGRVGPAWYREGIAELVATHRYDDGKLHLAQMPSNKQHVEYWGRIRIVQDEMQKGQIRSIQSIVDARPRDFLQVESYAWSWALQAFGHAHPVYRKLFTGLKQDMHVAEEQVTQQFLRGYRAHQHHVDAAWHVFLHQLDYGYDATQEVIQHAERVQPIAPTGSSVSIAATSGWQSSGLQVPAKTDVTIRAQGRFQVAHDSAPWWSEPQGVTLEYYQGQPLGVLLGAVVAPTSAGRQAFAQPIVIGRQRTISSDAGGVLYLRVNERADRMKDNQGTVSVHVKLDSAGL